MKKYKVGLDFGTSTSKTCVFDNEKNEFSFLKINSEYFFPTIIGLDEDGNIHFGKKAHKHTAVFQYFKMASLIEEDFKIYNKNTKSESRKIYSSSNFKKYSSNLSYSPEFLSSIYLAELFLKIEENLKVNSKTRKIKGLLGKLSNKKKEDISVSYVVGFPTEFNTNAHFKRKLKMQSILLIAFELKKIYNSLEGKSIVELENYANNIYKDLKLDSEKINIMLKEYGLSLYPEAAASLTFIRENRGIVPPGNYMTMDIGAGTTDISFINIDSRYNFRYFASESLPIASNNVHSIANNTKDLNVLRNASNKIKFKSKKYINAQLEINKSLELESKKIFWDRVGPRVVNIKQQYHDQPCLVYGGGANFHFFKNGYYTIFDNGSIYTMNDEMVTRLNKEALVNEDNFTVNVKNLKGIEKTKLSRLITCFGLASVSPKLSDFTTNNKNRSINDDLPEWLFVEDYIDNRMEKSYVEVEHPTNEGMYIKKEVFQVVDQEWI